MLGTVGRGLYEISLQLLCKRMHIGKLQKVLSKPKEQTLIAYDFNQLFSFTRSSSAYPGLLHTQQSACNFVRFLSAQKTQHLLYL